ncbi:MAG: TonB-dependent receptor plug domain-containing protein [Raineya sp.]|nr:TonB-dependent receptor plug domain-containing protein [Raineya sp.]MDW8295716.1 TonB-dependent receptor plug domain-containing protein [Raineya sp.]
MKLIGSIIIAVAICLRLMAQTDSIRAFQLSVDEDILKANKIEKPKTQVYSTRKVWEETEKIPHNVWVISKEDIRLSGALHIAEALRLCPFLLVRQGVNGVYEVKMLNSFYSVSDFLGTRLKGIETGINFLLLIDNMPYNDDLKGDILWETLPIDINDVEQIEIVTNPLSAIWGGNATQGVIHIITHRKEKGSDLQVEANLQGGIRNSFVHNATARIGIGETWHFKISANYASLERFENNLFLFSQSRYIPADSLLYFDQYGRSRNEINALGRQNWGVNCLAYFTPNKKYQADLHLFAQNSLVQGYWEDTDVNLVTRGSNSVGANFNAQLSGLHIQSSYIVGNRDFAKGYLGKKFNFSQFNATAFYPFSWKNLNFTPEFAYWAATYDDTPYVFDNEFLSPTFNQKALNTSLAGGLRMHTSFLKDKFLVELALRGEKFNQLSTFFIAPQFSMSYKLNKTNSLNLVISQGYRRNFVLEMFASYRDAGYIASLGRPIINFIPASNNLTLTQNQQINFNYHSVISSNLGLQVGLFYQQAKNYLTTSLIEENNGEIVMSFTNPENASTQQQGITGKIYFQTPKIYTSIGGLWSNNQTENRLLFSETPNWILHWQGKLEGLLQGKLSLLAYLYAYNASITTPTGELMENHTLFLPNLKLSFKIFQQGLVYVNARNIGTRKQELAFFERVRDLYLIGVEFMF